MGLTQPSITDWPFLGVILAGDFHKLDLKPLCHHFNLTKSVRDPTRHNNILDQMLTNMKDLYNPTVYLPPIGRSDLQCLFLSPQQRSKPSVITQRVRITRPENLIALGSALSFKNWERVSLMDVNDSVYDQ